MKKLLNTILIAACLVGCKPGTEITGSWKNTNVDATGAPHRINTILVTTLTAKANVRQTVENDLATALGKNGYNAIKSIDVLPPTFTNGEKPDREALLSKIKETSANAILTVALINKETETRYVPGNYAYAPMPRFGFYGTFWGYYNAWHPTLYSPGYYAEDRVYFIETNLYDANTQELLWSAQSETYNPASLADFSKDFSKVVVSAIEQNGLLKRERTDELAKERTRNQNE